MRTSEDKVRSESGGIISFYSGVAKLDGLESVALHELLLDASGKPAAIVIGFDAKGVEALFFDVQFPLEGRVFRSGHPFSINLSASYVGRIVDGLGRALDGLGSVPGEATSVFNQAPPIVAREPVTEPLSTGIKIIDTNLPLGRGQRELLIGDRKLGKSTLAADIVLNQKKAQPPVICIYVVCGQKEQFLEELISLFRDQAAFLYTVVVAATAGSSLAEQYLAPFVGCSIGEYFRDRGQHALVIYDDLSKHAKAYRDISLLLERAPGREAYPGDVFSLHATLLERAAKLAKQHGGGSLAALPIIETQEGDITSFIPTNLISITDGQVYLERGLYQKGFIPAVNVGLSVSRVGGQAQPAALRDVVGGMRLALSLYKELQKLSQLETKISLEARNKIERGDLMLELLKQDKHTKVSWQEQVVLFYAVEKGYFDGLERDGWKDFERMLLELVRNRYPHLLEQIATVGLDDVTKKQIAKVIDDFKQEFVAS